MKYYFIINPESGRFAKEKEEFLERIDKACKIREIPYEVIYTEGLKRAGHVAKSIQCEEEHVLFSVGGDGNLNEMINGIADKNVTVGVIPTGTGNDFYRTLNRLPQGENICDLGVVNGKYFINIACIGLDAEIANNVEVIRKKKWIPISQRFNASILYTFFKYRFKELKITFGNDSKKGEYTIVTVCNGQYYGAGHRIAPHAIIDDGFFELYFVKKMPKLLIPWLLAQLKLEKHEKSKRVVRYSDKEITFESDMPIACNVDGEVMLDTKFEIHLEKGAIKVLNDKKFVEEILNTR